MILGIVVTIANGFGKKGYYHSQEIGLAKELHRRGYDIIIYKYVPIDEQMSVEQIEPGITMKYIPCKKFGVHGLMPASVLDSDLDAVIMFSDTQIAVKTMYQHCQKHHIPFIPFAGISESTIRGKLVSTCMNTLFHVRTLPVYKQNPPIVKTQDVKQQFEALGVHGCVVANAGLDFSNLYSDFQTENRVKIRKKWGYSEQDNIILSVARMEPHKHPLELVDIFTHVVKRKPESKLIIIGTGPLFETVQEKVNTLDMNDIVLLPGRVAYNEMWQWYYIADYFVNLSSIEIFGMSIMEAIYYRTAVAAIRARGPEMILAKMQNCPLCDTYQEIEDYLTSPRPAEEVLQSNARTLQTEFTWKNCADACCSKL